MRDIMRKRRAEAKAKKQHEQIFKLQIASQPAFKAYSLEEQNRIRETFLQGLAYADRQLEEKEKEATTYVNGVFGGSFNQITADFIKALKHLSEISEVKTKMYEKEVKEK